MLTFISCTRDPSQSIVSRFIALYNSIENDKSGIVVLDVSNYSADKWISDLRNARKVNGPLADDRVSRIDLANGGVEYEILANDGNKVMRLVVGPNGLIVGFGIGNNP